MAKVQDVFEKLSNDEQANYTIRTLLAEGKRRYAAEAVMSTATDWDYQLNNDEAEQVIDLFTEDDRTAEQITRDQFPDRDIDLGMKRTDTIVDPEHRLAPMPSELEDN